MTMTRNVALISFLMVAATAACAPMGPAAPGEPPTAPITLTDCTPGAVMGTTYLETEVTKKPVLLEAGRIRYPRELRDGQVSGFVRLAFVIDAIGVVVPSSIKVLQSSDVGFEEVARTMVSGGRYVPGEMQGRKVAVCVSQTVRFTP